MPGAPTTVDRLLLLALTLIWGGSFSVNRIALDGFAPEQVACGRLAIGALALAAAMRAAGGDWPRQPRVWGWMAAMALVGNAVPFFAISWGQQRVPSGAAGVLMAVMPLATAALAPVVVAGARLARRRATGFLAGFLGVVVLLGPEALAALGGRGSDLARQSAILGGALCYAVNTIIARRAPDIGLLPVSASVNLLGFLALAPAALAAGVPVAGAGPIAALVFLGVAATALATWIYYRLICGPGPTFLSLINYLIPMIAVVGGIVALGERPEPHTVAALVVILAGVAMAQSSRRSR